MRRRALGILGAAVLFAGCGREPPAPLPAAPPDDPFADAAITARVERLRPLVEEVVGAPLGPVRVVVCDRREWVDRYATRESIEARSADPSTEIRRWWRAQFFDGFIASQLQYGNVWREDGEVWLIAENFAAHPPEEREGILDVVLAHEMAHVHQLRSRGLVAFVDAASTAEEEAARDAVVEGHAEWVAREVARRIGREREFVRIRAWTSSEPNSAVAVALMRWTWHEQRARNEFSYVQGLEFVDSVLRRLGVAEGVRTIFESPPATPALVLRPERYPGVVPPTPPDPVPLLEPAWVPEREADRRFLLLPVVRREVAALGPEGDEALAGFESAERATGRLGLGRFLGLGATLRSTRFEAPDGAARFLAALRTAIVARGTPMEVVGAPYEVVEGRADPLGPDVPGFVAAVSVGAAVPEALCVGLRVDRTALVLAFHAPAEAKEAARDLGRRCMELASGDPDRRARARAPFEGLEEAPVERLVERLEDADPEVRGHVLSLLGRAPRSEASRSALLRALDGPDLESRDLAARGLAAAATDSPEVAARLRVLLADGQGHLRRQAILSLHEADTEMDAASFERLRADPDPRVRSALIVASGGVLGTADEVDRLLALARDPDAGIRTAAWTALAPKALLHPPSREAVAHALADPDPAVRTSALTAFGWGSLFDLSGSAPGRGPPPLWLVQAAAGRLDDPSVEVRVAAATALAGMPREAAARHVPALLAMLEDPVAHAAALFAVSRLVRGDPRAARAVGTLLHRRSGRRDAAAALGEMGDPGGGARAPLRALLDVPHPRTRIAAARALRTLRDRSAPPASYFLRDLEHPAFQVRVEALAALKEWDEGTPEVVRAVGALARSGRAIVRKDAIETLAEIAPSDPGLPEVVAEAFLDDDKGVRRAARWVVDYTAESIEEPVFAAVHRVLEEGSETQRRRAALALAEARRPTPDLDLLLVAALESGSREERMRAVEGLEDLRERRPTTAGALASRLGRETDPEVRGEVERVLAGLDDAVLAVPDLVRGLDSTDPEVVRSAARVLGAMGAESKGAVPALRALLESAPPSVREAVADALGKIERR